LKYFEPHHHTTFSYQDGHGTPWQHAEEAARLGMTASAVTEHGNVSSHVQHEKACDAFGLKPVFGLEAYTHPDPKSQRKFHLTLLAENQTGYQNLMRIVTRSWAENFYYYPTVSGQMLAEHNEGLIVLSGCSDSLLACSLLGGKTIEPWEASADRARDLAWKFKDLLGDRFYLECQAFPELERTHQINQAYEQMGDELGIPLVATGDVHTVRPGDHEMRAILHAAGRGSNTVAQQMSSWEYEVPDYLMRSDRDAFDRLRGTGLGKLAAQQAARSTAEIATRCNVRLPRAELLRFPVDQVAPGLSSEELIWKWMRDGWTYRVRQGNRRMADPRNRQEYLDRLAREMGDIKAKDFIDYFLMNSDAVRFAKDSGIPVGPARGSAAASLVCYLLRITEIDPLEYPLMYFERFIDPTRTDIPDIDLDFAGNRRHEVREYLERRYGPECVGNIANYVRYKGKNSIDDVGRVYSIPKPDVDLVKSMIVERSGGDSRGDFSLLDTVEMFPVVRAVFDKHPDLWKATKLQGNYKGMSVHAAGLVVTNAPINTVCATYAREVKGHPVEVVSVDKYDAEYLNLLKVDFLGLNTMEMIEEALGIAGLSLEELYRIPMNDQETMDAFTRNDVVGIFQFEGRATRLVNRDIKPTTFMELADINALSRPGPLFSGTTADYKDVKWQHKQPRHWHPIIDDLTKETRYQIIYQEQILKTLELVGGLPVAEVHEIRKIISKKLGEAKFNESAESFAAGAFRLHGIDAETAHGIWGRLVTSATYAFNVAHCISYSMLGFWCMWLKVHHPAAFYTAQLRKTKEELWPRLIKDAERHGVRVRGVTPGRSGKTWTATDDGSIVAGWLQLKGVGPVLADRIGSFVEGRQINSADELLAVKGIGPAILAKCRDQLESDDPFGLQKIAKALNEIRTDITEGRIPLRPPTHTSDELLDLPAKAEVIWIGIPRLKEYKDYIEDERARSGKTVDEIKAEMWHPDKPTSCTLHCNDDGDEDVYVRVKRQDYDTWRSGLESIRPGRDVVYVRAVKSQNSFGASLFVKDLVVITPDS
jgi:DNA polymerase-3 subunit alpha